MARRLSTKQENFCLNYVKLDFNGTQAVLASGYHCKDGIVAKSIATENLSKPYIMRRIEALKKRLEDAAIADPIERRKVLTELVRARAGHFTDENGNLAVKRDQLNNAAVQEVSTETTLTGYRTKLKLRDPVAAIDLLNKMDKLYADVPASQVSNTQINIIVSSDKAKELSEKVAERLLSGNGNR